MAYPRIADSNLKLRLQLAAAGAGIALALMFIAVKFQSRDYLSSRPSQKLAGRHYARMWFDSENRLVGASRQGSNLAVERWNSGSLDWSRQFRLTGIDNSTSDVRWAMDSALESLAWTAGTTLYVQPANSSQPAAKIELPQDRTVLALTVASDGSAAVAFSDGSLMQWSTATGAPEGSRQLDLKRAEQGVAEGDYLALASADENRLLLYHFTDQNTWMVVAESAVPYPPYRLVLPAPGQVAAFAAGGIRIEGVTRNSPGPLTSVAAHFSDIIAAGDFDNVFVLADDGDSYPLADARPESTIAASEAQLAISAPDGTVLLDLGKEVRVTAAGRKLTYASVGLLALSGLLACSGFLGRGMQFSTKALQPKVDAPVSLPDPPEQLVEGVASGRAVLWAGAGLSAQAGYPTRSAFIASVLQAASIDVWVPSARLQKYAAMVSHGDGEAALSDLVASASSAVRSQLIAHFKSIYFRFAVPSRSHRLLARMPFVSAVTTNYERLLEAMPQPWASIPVTLDFAPRKAAEPSCLVRLFGDLSDRSALLSRTEFEAAAARGAFMPTLRQMLATQSVMFVGCSLEGLITDLAKIGVPDKRERTHFAVAGVSSPAWKKQAEELSERYGIRVLACGAEQIPGALPVFLEKLAAALDRLRGSEPEGETTEAIKR